MSTPNKFLILGGKSGQLGEALSNAIIERDMLCVAPERHILDITNTERVRASMNAERPNILINVAAITSPVACEHDPDIAYRIHADAVLELSKLSREYSIPFVTISTDYVFDGKKGNAYTEEDPPNPLQVYGASKFKGELLARSVYPEKTFIIRTSALYGGRYGSPHKGNFVLSMREKMSKGEAPDVVSDLITSPTYAPHLAHAILDILSQNTPGGVYHLAGEGQASWFQFASAIHDIFNLSASPHPITYQPKPQEFIRPRFTALKNTKANMIGIRLPPWEEGLTAYKSFLQSASL